MMDKNRKIAIIGCKLNDPTTPVQTFLMFVESSFCYPQPESRPHKRDGHGS